MNSINENKLFDKSRIIADPVDRAAAGGVAKGGSTDV